MHKGVLCNLCLQKNKVRTVSPFIYLRKIVIPHFFPGKQIISISENKKQE